MTGRYKPYSEYKDSGIEWLGKIPKCWTIKKLKYICSVGTGTKDTANAVDDGVYPFFVRSQTIERINSLGADCEAVLTAGDGVGVGKVFHYYNGKFDYHQRVYMLNNFNLALGKFVYYYLSNNFYKVALEGNAKSTVDSLRMPQFLNFEFSLPEQELQKKIVLFLDHETAKIDTLIEKQQQLIQLLKEKRQAVINHAVTKGLNPNAIMRDSEIEWLRDIPTTWKAIKFGITHKKAELGGNYPSGEGDDGFPLIKMGNLDRGVIKLDKIEYLSTTNSFDKAHFLEDGDFLFNTRNSLELVGKVAIWRSELPQALFNSNILRITFKKEFISCNYFMNYLFGSDFCLSQLRLIAKGTTSVAAIYYKELSSLIFAFPPLEDQIKISKFLDEKTLLIDDLINKANGAIALMQERRTALIYAAVTGKIDVRNWVAPQSNQTNKEVAA